MYICVPVSLLQTGQMEVDNFVQELLTMIRVSPNKQLEKQERLVQWVKVTVWVWSACWNKDFSGPFYGRNIGRIFLNMDKIRPFWQALDKHFVYKTPVYFP